MAHDLMGQHNLFNCGWEFKFDNAKRRFGYCSYRPRFISLSRPLTEINCTDEVRDTILHEIAHALDVTRHGSSSHGVRWKRICVEVGARPIRCGKSINPDAIKSPYKFVCKPCNKEFPRFRKPKRTTGYRCNTCKSTVEWVVLNHHS
jgi:predicted SprT family Zn-dependent metalloprotease